MQTIKEKNQKKVTLQTHCKTMGVVSELGVNPSTLYRDIKFLGIELIKDEDNVSWISHEDKKKVLALRKHIKETGKRTGFEPENVEDLMGEEPSTAVSDTIEETSESVGITMTEKNELATRESTEMTTTESGVPFNDVEEMEEEIYVEPKDQTDGFDPNEIIREGAKLKARELAMPHLVKRAIADSMSEEELPEDLKQKVRLAREAANPKFTPQQVAQTLLANYRKKLVG